MNIDNISSEIDSLKGIVHELQFNESVEDLYKQQLINMLNEASNEFSTLQRAATHLASLTDINEAYEVGAKAVSEANNGSTSKMVIITRKNSKDYKSSTSVFDIHDIANVEKKVPASMIDSKNHQMTDEYLEYAKPLIMGELVPIFKDGLPQHLILK